MSFDLSKCPRNEAGHYLCRTTPEGWPVRIVATDFRDIRLVAIVCNQSRGIDEVATLTVEEASKWLENIPTKVKRWVNCYRNPDGNNYEWSESFTTIAAANKRAEEMGANAWGVAVPVEFEVKP